MKANGSSMTWRIINEDPLRDRIAHQYLSAKLALDNPRWVKPLFGVVRCSTGDVPSDRKDIAVEHQEVVAPVEMNHGQHASIRESHRPLRTVETIGQQPRIGFELVHLLLRRCHTWDGFEAGLRFDFA